VNENRPHPERFGAIQSDSEEKSTIESPIYPIESMTYNGACQLYRNLYNPLHDEQNTHPRTASILLLYNIQ